MTPAPTRLPVEHDLAWLHEAVRQARWQCDRREFPREWSLAVSFWRVTPGAARSEPESLEVTVRQDKDGASRAENLRFFRGSFKAARDFLHAKVLRASRTGTIDGRPFLHLLPPTSVPPDVALGYERGLAFEDRFYLLEPTDSRPGVWALEDKRSGKRVEFRLPPGAGRGKMRRLTYDAIRRVEALNARDREVRRMTAREGLVVN